MADTKNSSGLLEIKSTFYWIASRSGTCWLKKYFRISYRRGENNKGRRKRIFNKRVDRRNTRLICKKGEAKKRKGIK